MVSPASARQMLIDSDYPLDKIVYYTENSINLAGFSGLVDVYYSHGLMFTPLPMMEWTTDPTWKVKYEVGSGPINGNGFIYNTSVSARLTNPDIWMTFRNNTASPVTIYYRTYGLPPSNLAGELAAFTNNLKESYLLNSDFNYTKLYMADIVNLPSIGAGIGTTIVPHDLLVRPQVLAWTESTLFGIQPVSGQNPEDASTPFALFDTSWLEARNDGLYFYNRNSAKKYHYRMYVDELIA